MSLEAPAPKKQALGKTEESQTKPLLVSVPVTPPTPANSFVPILSPNSVTSHSSSCTVEDDVAYLKNSNSLLLSEISQMKRKTQTQEDTIAWLIAELARTQRQMESLKQNAPTGNKLTMSAINPSQSTLGYSQPPQSQLYATPQYQQQNIPTPMRRQSIMPNYDMSPASNLGMSSISEVVPSSFQDPEAFQTNDVYAYENYYDNIH